MIGDDVDVVNLVDGDCRDLCSVFVYVVELGQGVEDTVAPVPVRLEFAHELDEAIRRAIELAPKYPVQVGWGVADGKLRVSGGRIARVDDSGVRKEIKGGAKIVDCVSEDGSHIWRQRPFVGNLDVSHPIFWVFLADKAVWVFGEELFGKDLEITDVRVCPIDFEASAGGIHQLNHCDAVRHDSVDVKRAARIGLNVKLRDAAT
jgi:hypothetical protein